MDGGREGCREGGRVNQKLQDIISTVITILPQLLVVSTGQETIMII